MEKRIQAFIDSLEKSINFFDEGIADVKSLKLWLKDNKKKGFRIKNKRNNEIDDYILKIKNKGLRLKKGAINVD